MFRLSRQVSTPAIRVSSRYFTTVKLPCRQNFWPVGAAQDIPSASSGSHVGNDGLPILNSCAGFRAYSTGKDTEKTPEAQTSGSVNESQNVSESIRSREPTNMERKVFVWTGKYKTVDEVPKLVSEAALTSAKSKFRIYINLGMGAATIIAAIGMIFIGKSRSKRGESLTKLNIERHPETYGKMVADPKK